MIPDCVDAPDGGSVVVPLLVEYHTVYVIPDPDTAVHETVKDGDVPDTPLVTVTGGDVGDGIADVAVTSITGYVVAEAIIQLYVPA